MFLQLPTLLLSLPATLCLSWLVTYRRLVLRARAEDQAGESRGAPVPPALSGPSRGRELLRAQAHIWVQHNRLELALALVGIVAGLAVLIVSYTAAAAFPRHPGAPGRPFSELKSLRELGLRSGPLWATAIAALGGLASSSLLIVAQLKRLPAAAGLGLLVAALGLGGLGQLAFAGMYDDVPPVLYALAVLFFAVWAWTFGPAHSVPPPAPARWSWQEIGLLAAVMLLAIYGRFYGLQTVPYGIEGDEGRWTVEVVRAMEEHGFRRSGDSQLSSVPVSFYMQVPFHRLFGPGLLSARLAVATFGLLGCLAFYWLARQLFGVPVALLATLLLSVSIFDLSASRLANVESHVKLWPLLTLGLLARAGRVGGTFSYALAGLGVAISVLTYDTLFPLIALGAFLALHDVLRAGIALRQAVRRLLAYLVPQILVAPIVVAYITSRSVYYDVARRWSEQVFGTLAQHAGELAESLFQAVRPDFLYNRAGPLFNSMLLPWLVLGCVLALVNWNRGRLLWILAYVAAFFLPAPLLMNAPMGRVLYPALPAAYLLVALAMAAAVRAASQVLGRSRSPILYSACGIALAVLVLSNLYIYFNEVRDPGDRQIRRELYETTRSAAGSGTALFFPYKAQANEPIEQEKNRIIWLGLRAAGGAEGMAEVLPVEALLPTLAAVPVEIDHAEVIWSSASGALAANAGTLAALVRCYAPIVRMPGEYFDRYLIDRAVLDRPACRSGTLTLEPAQAELAQGEPVRARWSLSGAAAASLSLTCTTLRPDALIVEAEHLQGPGWVSLTGLPTGFEGTGFLADNPGSAAAQAEVWLPPGRPIYAWVRTFPRLPDELPGQLTLDGVSLPFGGETTLAIGEWGWQPVGEFSPADRQVRLSLERPYPDAADTHLALLVDVVLLTASPSLDPARDLLWTPSVQQNLAIGDSAAGDFSLALPEGMHRCSLQALGAGVIGPDGGPGLTSNGLEVIVSPRER